VTTTGTAAVFRGLATAPLVFDPCVDASLPMQPARTSTENSEMSARTLATLLIHPDIRRFAVIIPQLSWKEEPSEAEPPFEILPIPT
jgi:hypothetical protein